jgi:hypothetical protein
MFISKLSVLPVPGGILPSVFAPNSCDCAGFGTGDFVGKEMPANVHHSSDEPCCGCDQAPISCIFAGLLADPALFFLKNCTFGGSDEPCHAKVADTR